MCQLFLLQMQQQQQKRFTNMLIILYSEDSEDDFVHVRNENKILMMGFSLAILFWLSILLSY